MPTSDADTRADARGDESANAPDEPKRRTGMWIGIGLLLGILCGIFFGEYCRVFDVVGRAYVGLLQMSVLPYLTIALIGKLGRLDLRRAGRIGATALIVLLIFWAIGITLIVAVSAFLPPVQAASFFSSDQLSVQASGNTLDRFIPTNIFRSLTEEYIPAVVVFCLFFGCALVTVSGKERLLDALDLISEAIGQINSFLVRLAPFGLFALTAAAAGTLRLEEFARLQAYLILLGLASLIAAFGALPVIVTSFAEIRYWKLIQAAQEPLLTAIATGKLFVVLPQIIAKCEELTPPPDEFFDPDEQSVPSVVVPLAYSFPHLGKILAFVFISFAAWYVGEELSASETAVMASTGAMSSFASPLISIPYLLDQYRLPQDVMPLFILPGFITMRLGDVVGVMSLMSLTVIVTHSLHRRKRISWSRLLWGSLLVCLCLVIGGVASHWYLSRIQPDDDLGTRLLSLALPSAYENVIVYQSREDAPPRESNDEPVLDRMINDRLLRVGYDRHHLPYTYINKQGQLVGYDVELVHRLAKHLNVDVEFIPVEYETLVEQIDSGEIDMAIGGLMTNPERLTHVGFSKPYGQATLSVLIVDHRRNDIHTWDDLNSQPDLRLGVLYDDVAVAARRMLPDADITEVESFDTLFEGDYDLEGLLLPAEEAAAWNVLYPEYTVVVPEPVTIWPVAIAGRASDTEWLRFLDGWLDFKDVDGSLETLQEYWVRGGGTRKREPRWSVIRNVLHWVP